MSSLYLLLALCAALRATTPDSYRIQKLPYYTGTLTEMYSGFLEVEDGDTSKQLFFWFFVNEENKQNSDFPVMLWLNGGPGISSMYGLFTENGPFQISEDGSGKPEITDMKHTWTKAAHMLYIDQPAGVGFSFVTEDSQLATSDTQAAVELHAVLKRFFSVFTDYKDNPFYMSGQSYAGKYIPYTAQAILNSQDNSINLKGLIMGSPFLHGEIQRIMMKDLAEAAGLVQGNQLSQLDGLRVRCQEAFKDDPVYFLDQCDKVKDFIQDMSLVDAQNILNLADSSTYPYELYLNGTYSSEIFPDLHVSSSPKSLKFEHRSAAVTQSMAATKMTSSLGIIESLLSRALPMLWYIGQFDGLDGLVGNQYLLQYIEWPRKSAFQVAPRWLYNTTEGNIAGYFKQVDDFTWVILSNAGHNAAGDQRTNTLAMIQDYLTSGHKLSQNQGYDTPQLRMCEFMNYCHGNGVCNVAQGLCDCNDGYFGQDCSYQVPDMKLHQTNQDAQVLLSPQAWYFMRHDDNIYNSEHLVISAKQAREFTLYGFNEGDFNRGALPDQQNFKFRLECLSYYVHYNKGDKRRPSSSQQSYVTQILGIYNPHPSEPVDIEIKKETIYLTPVTYTEASIWSPPHALFFLEMLVVLGTLVSVVFNLYQHTQLKKLSGHSYSVANVNSTIPPSMGTQFLGHGSLKSEDVTLNKSKSFMTG